MSDNVISTKALKKHYIVGNSTVCALDNVDISIERGEFICISGRSGSGKSTILNMLAGLELPTSGEVTVLNEHIERMTELERIRFRRKNIGFVFQSYNLMPQYTTLENIALPLAIRGVPIQKRIDFAGKILGLVGLSEHAEHKPTELSGGQQQRVGIARAIITRPQIVFADEPTGNLDTKTSAEIMELLTSIFKKWGTTFILVSHDPYMARYTDRTIIFSDGRIINTSSPEEEKQNA
ncbi:MAG: ABC transporter ATP-binding protein [Oscillospiraceae bacterium]